MGRVSELTMAPEKPEPPSSPSDPTSPCTRREVEVHDSETQQVTRKLLLLFPGWFQFQVVSLSLSLQVYLEVTVCGGGLTTGPVSPPRPRTPLVPL